MDILTASEMGRLGAKARNKKLSKKRRSEIASMGGKARAKNLKVTPPKKTGSL